MIWQIIRPSISRVSNVFFRAFKGRGKTQILGRVICQTIQWNFYYMTNLKKYISLSFLKDLHAFSSVSGKWFNENKHPETGYKVVYQIRNKLTLRHHSWIWLDKISHRKKTCQSSFLTNNKAVLSLLLWNMPIKSCSKRWINEEIVPKQQISSTLHRYNQEFRKYFSNWRRVAKMTPLWRWYEK